MSADHQRAQASSIAHTTIQVEKHLYVYLHMLDKTCEVIAFFVLHWSATFLSKVNCIVCCASLSQNVSKNGKTSRYRVYCSLYYGIGLSTLFWIAPPCKHVFPCASREYYRSPAWDLTPEDLDTVTQRIKSPAGKRSHRLDGNIHFHFMVFVSGCFKRLFTPQTSDFAVRIIPFKMDRL